MDTPDIAADYGNRPDGPIEILHRLQQVVGYVPDTTFHHPLTRAALEKVVD